MDRLFDKIYAASKEVLDALKKPVIENRVKRKFGSAIDSAEEQKADAYLRIQKIRENLPEYDINKIVEEISTIEAADTTIAAIKKEYKELFGEEYK